MKSFKALAVIATTVATLAAGGCASTHQSAQRSDGSKAAAPAAQDLKSAVEAMRSTRGYRFVATVQTDKQSTVARGEFEAPDKVHETVSVGDRPVAELVSAGTRVVLRDPKTGAWRTQRATSPGAASDPRAAFAALTQARDVRKEGETYRFTVPKEAGATLVRGTSPSGDALSGTATIVGGRITSLDFTVSGGARTLQVHVVYSEIDAAPPVVVPA